MQLRDLGDFSEPKAFNVNVNSHLCPGENDGVSYQRNKRAEPYLKFEVIITPREGGFCKREFAWALPQNHQSRLLDELYQWTLNEYEDNGYGNALPVFTMPYIPEIFMAADEENVNRLVGTALQRRVDFSTDCCLINLLSSEGFDNRDNVKSLLDELSISYQHFLMEYEKTGFFKALEEKYDPLRIAYCAAIEKYLQSNQSSVGPLLFRAFMIVADDIDDIAEQNWVWNEYQECMVVTPLHPALLEMIHNRHTFLCESFCFYARNGLLEVGEKFLEKTWGQILDLSRIKWPICGTLKNESLTLDTNVRSYGYFHLVGECAEDPTSINARLLLEYEDNDDEDITDTDLLGKHVPLF